MTYIRLFKNGRLSTCAALVAVVVSCRAASLVDLIPRADAILIGTASVPAISGQTLSFQLSVEQSLTGGLRPGAILDLRWKSWAPGVQIDGGASRRGIWFLTRSGEGRFEIIPVRMGTKAFFHEFFYRLSADPLPGVPDVSQGASVEDRIVALMASSAAVDGNDQILEASALLDSDGIRKALQHLAAQSAPRPMCVGLAGLIARDDLTSLGRVEAIPASTAVSDLKPVEVAVRVWFRNPDNRAAAVLGRLAKFGARGVQDAAIHALVAMHTRASVPVLAGFLDDPESTRQQAAVAGLAAFANGLPIQRLAHAAGAPSMPAAAPGPYQTPETERHTGLQGDSPSSASTAESVAFWKTWWRLHRADFEQ